MKNIVLSVGVVCLVMTGCISQEKEEDENLNHSYVVAKDQISAGRYLVTVGGCNDCHTSGYLEKGMKIPEVDWLTGSPVGWQGPWGTTIFPEFTSPRS